ncbi:hypothetical protein P22_2470 [Propionispora sp. 2/2-37]|nr:hypothetical protein P22_2470 [Propionispora sp. 2/2-37]
MAHTYQQYSIEYILNHPTAALFLDCGLGKTVITLTAIFDLILDSFQIRKALVIAPLRVARDTWPAEIEKWDHLKGLTYAVAVGSEAKRRLALAKKAHIYLINRENVPWLIEESGLPFDFDMVVIDELSSFKSHQAKRFKSLLKVRPKIKRIIGLTGTPAANGLIDLWAEFRLLDLGARLGRFIGNYRSAYFIPDKRNQQMVFSYKPKPGAEQAIYRQIADIAISMKNTDYLKLPPLVMNKIAVRLSSEERRHYQTLKDELVLSIKGQEIDAACAAALSNKLLQMASGAVYDETGSAITIHDRKLEALEDIIEAANGKPVLVAYWFKHDLERIYKRLPAEPLDSADSIRRWNAGKIPVAVIHPASAGHGLNLQTGGAALVWFSLTWSLELYQQTIARLWRQGQTETVVVHHIIAKDTIDEDVMAALDKKEAGQAALLSAVKARMGRDENEYR